MDPESHFFLSDTKITEAEKYLKEMYPCTGNRDDNFQISDSNSNPDNTKYKSKLANLADDLGKNNSIHKFHLPSFIFEKGVNYDAPLGNRFNNIKQEITCFKTKLMENEEV